MACVAPLKAYRGEGGQIVFSAKDGFSDLPLRLACGQCIGCRIAKSRAWALRCVHEASLHEDSCFVTLTYSDAEVPPDGSLRVEDWQKFAKRVRKQIGKFRFFHVGEYGEQTYRPHYHALLFGVAFRKDRVSWRRTGGAVLDRSPTLERLWPLGHSVIGEVSFASAAYCARYALKKVNGDRASERYRRIDVRTGEEYYVRPEYVTMSRRPGVGAGWFEKYGNEVFPDDEVVHAGKTYRVPAFYDRLLERENPELAEAVKVARVGRAMKYRKELSLSRLAAKEAVLSARYREDRRFS